MGRDVEWITSQLRAHLVQGDALRAVEPLSSGHSNDTFHLDGLDLILRMTPSDTRGALVHGHPIGVQYHVLAAVGAFAQGPPVPGVRYLCDDPDVLGAPFCLMQRVPGTLTGEYEPETWFAQADAEIRSSVCDQYVSAVAAVNALPALDVLGPVRPPVQVLGHWAAVAAKSGNDDLAELFTEVSAREAPSSGPCALVHGDSKLGNVMFSMSGDIQALVDWEMSFNGEPLHDLGYMLFQFPHPAHAAMPGCDLPGMWDREAIIARWAQVTGRSPDGIEFYEILAVLQIAAIFSYAGWLHDEGRNSDPRFAVLAQFVPPLVSAAREMAGVLA